MDENLSSISSLNQSTPCSGHGEFMTTTNTCFCDIRFSGSSCSGTNINYHLALSITYLIVALVSLIQLVTSMVMSIVNNGKESGSKSKTPSISSSSDHDQQNQNGGSVGVGESSSSLHHPQIQIQQRNNLRGIIAHSAFREALTPTTPKAIYAVVFLMSSMRAAYFAASATLTGDWLLSSLLSAYYPLLLTGSSLIVCFWAEIFHLRNKRIVSYKYLSHRFLGKSFLGFLSFNVITYSLLLAQLLLILSNTADQQEKSYYLNIFNGCYAFLILIVVIFFLIYGVEVYFKLRIEDYLKSRKGNKNKEANKHEELIGKFQPGGTANANTPLNEKSELSYKVNTSQLHQSRLGLISQAVMLIVTVLFILSDILGDFWKSKIPIKGRNYHNVMFSLVEIGCTLWFPCVLWNVHRPEQLWVLNPKKIINSARRNSSNNSGPDAKLQAGESYNPIDSNINQDQDDESEETESDISESSHVGCYFCYDPDRTDAGDLIQPCACRGDVGSVHHDCLKKWLIQQAGQLENQDDHEYNSLTSAKQPKKPLQIPEISCSICKTPYSIVKPSFIRRRGENSSSAFSFNPSYATSALTSCASISSQHWLKLSLLLSLISGIFMFTFALCHILPAPPYKVLVVGIALILLYLILKFLGQNTLSAYQQAKVSSLTILSLRRRASSDEENIEENSGLNNGLEPSSSSHMTTKNNLTNNMHKTLIAEDIILTHSSSSSGGHINSSRNFFELSPGGLVRGVKDKSPPIQIIKSSSKQNTHNSVPKN